MRLINVYTLELEYFHADPPPFAILSHSWGAEEVTLQDVLSQPRDRLNGLEGWRKVVGFCAAMHGHQDSLLARGPVSYAWVDTCCIDKTSSAELSEAINCMFRWYRSAAACFVLLTDVTAGGDGPESKTDYHLPRAVVGAAGGPGGAGAAVVGDEFEASRWFTRGWTLQELLAPREVYFFDRNWELLGDKMSLAERIARRTRIDLDVVLTGWWEDTSVAQRMSWAADRQTTRREDVAYCLMGIFDVNMPLLYGEGDKAFIRLQEEILKESGDHSILAWDASDKDEAVTTIGALATHPSQFRRAATVEALQSDGSLTISPRGIQSNMPVISQKGNKGLVSVALLDCRYANDLSSRVGILVRKVANTGAMAQYERTRSAPISVPLRQPIGNTPPAIHLVKRDRTGAGASRALRRCWLRFGAAAEGLEPVLAIPEEHWHISPARSMTMELPRVDGTVVTAIAFSFTSSPDGIRYCMVLRMDPEKAIGTVGLRRVELEADTGNEELLRSQLYKLRRDAESVATKESDELLLGEWMLRNSLHATLGVIRDGGSMFEVVLSSKVKPWPSAKPKLPF
ncbi:hypothetical protein ACO1O0_003810 [Amphichorda felina]